MFDGFIKAYGRINPKRVPEESIGLRLSVMTAILIAEISILAMGYYDTLTVVAVPLLTAAGFAYSWRFRRQSNLRLKLVLSLLVVAVTVLFARELASSFYDTRLPLIKLLLWLQVLHSFDVPARRDLKFSLASGLTLIAAGAVLSTGMFYLVGLAFFSIAAVVSLVYFHISESTQNADHITGARPLKIITYGSLAWLAGIVLAIPLLLIMPQSTHASLHSLPISNMQKILGDFSPGVVNPSYPSGDNPFNEAPRFSPNSYFGFNPYMDLRSRGNLSDDIVLKVRSEGYDYYRGIVFDLYNGKGWEMSQEDAEDVITDSAPFLLDIPGRAVVNMETRVQSFYVESDLPNIIFASWKPEQLFFPADRIKVDGFGSLRSPYELTEGTVYSVISEKPVHNASLLHGYPRSTDAKVASQYTSLPDNPEMPEISTLAKQVTSPYANRYDQVVAIEKYLKDNYIYDLDIPIQTEDTDSVAYFLFEEKRGYCEHFASAMAVMARSVGIPARVVTGYSGGSYNPFTALWEIKQSDAHAWVEINFGNAGWVPFDPTPGFDVPGADNQQQSPWLASKLFSYLRETLGSGPVGSAFGYLGSALRSVISVAVSLPLAFVVGFALVIVVLAWGLPKVLRLLLRERRRRRLMAASLGHEYRSNEILKDYFELVMLLRKRGLCRRPEETLRAFARRVSSCLGAREFTELSMLVERLRYEEPQQKPSSREARDLAGKVMDEINDQERRNRGPATGLSLPARRPWR